MIPKLNGKVHSPQGCPPTAHHIKDLRVEAQEIAIAVFEVREHAKELLEWTAATQRRGRRTVRRRNFQFLKGRLGRARAYLRLRLRKGTQLTDRVGRLLNTQGRGPFRFFGQTATNAHEAAFQMARCGQARQIDRLLSAVNGKTTSTRLKSRSDRTVRLATVLQDIGEFDERNLDGLIAEIEIEADGVLITLEQQPVGPPIENAARLEVSRVGDKGRATLDGTAFPLTERQTDVLVRIISANGTFLPGKRIKSPGSSERPDQTIRRMPDPIRKCIQSQGGYDGGHRVNVTARVIDS